MNFLSLCQRLRLECVGVSGNGPVSVQGQTGDMLRVVNWVASAYQDIQNLHTDWAFLHREFSFDTVAGQRTYGVATAIGDGLTIGDVGKWREEGMKCYLTADGSDTEIPILVEPVWADFYDTYEYGPLKTQQGRPDVAGIKPNRTLALWPTPDAVYTLTGQYFRNPHVMVENTDTPLFDERYHMLIVWRALVFYAGHAAAPETFAVGQQEHKRLLSMLRRDELPAFSW